MTTHFAGSVPDRGRIGYLESIRGLAALQVLILHAFAAFVPGMAAWNGDGTVYSAIQRSPLFFLYDGYTAVLIFFTLSGFVLTLAFAGSRSDAWTQVPARVLRLAIPAALACLLSYVVVRLVGAPNVEAGQIVGSVWLSGLWRPHPDLGFLLKEMFVNGPLLGYADMSPLSFVGLAGAMDPVTVAYVGPLWSLSVELFGSVLILLLTILLRRSRVMWRLAILLSVVVLLRSYFLCFVVGHLLALPVLRDGQPRPLHEPVALGLVAAGIAICVAAVSVQPANGVCEWQLAFVFPCTSGIERIVGASLVFGGLISSPLARRVLEWPGLRFLGQISFSLYLVHWPIVLGLGSVVLLATREPFGLAGATLAAILCSLTVSLVVAVAFVPVDRLAIGASRVTRRRLTSGR
jgi:peptidoglycan/LPS O-acetylase OafA/YrhL